MDRAKCAVCERLITLRADGTFRNHGPQIAPCLGVNHTPDEAHRLILPTLTNSQLEMMRECWRIGDWRPIECEFGIRCQHYQTRADTPENELAQIVADTRRWIERVIQLSRSHGAQNFQASNDTRSG